MTKWRIYVSFDEKNFFWIVVDNGKLITKTDKEYLKGTKIKSYNHTNICPICREDWEKYGIELTSKSVLYPKNAFHGRKTGRWVCKKHIIEVTTKYKINVSFDKINFFWVVVDNGKFIMSPTEEDLKYAQEKYYNDTNMCPICRKECEKEGKELTNKSVLYPGNTYRNTDKSGKKVDQYVCTLHANRSYQRYNINSMNHIIKSLAHRRTGYLEYHNIILGDNCEKLTETLLRAKMSSIEYDNYELSYDHLVTPEGVSVEIRGKLIDLSGMILQTKGSTFKRYIGANGGYMFGKFDKEWNKKFDFEILWCISDDGLIVERGYIIPKKEVDKRTAAAILKYPTGYEWYERYRANDENLLSDANEAWKKIISKEIQ